MKPSDTSQTLSAPPAEPTTPEAFDEIDAILDEMRTRYDETPQWEFCEGFLAALVCCRRAIPQAEYLDVLLGVGESDDMPGDGSFADAAQRARFLEIWDQRLLEVKTALDMPTESLDTDTAYHPEVLDVRGAMAALSEEDRAAMPEGAANEPLPAFAQVWALGFMYVLEAWPEEWAPPRDKKAAKWHDLAIQCIVAMTEDDEGEPTVSPFSEDGPATLSVDRLDAFADAVWSVYDLREIWRGIGPRVETLHRADTPGRNDPCHCGSGKKFKKCHGA
ncbi:MAG: zinc chelation protein SecC [Burkholderiales bacterium PBB3]|nr:MAG: zinc chelation protein SecC [Burkholderiales bacterium PBB3]